jgi:hypothetical protein
LFIGHLAFCDNPSIAIHSTSFAGVSLLGVVGWGQVLQFVGEDGQALRQIFFLGDDTCWNVQPGGTEIPNAANARAHHEIGGFLRYRGGDSEDTQANTAVAHESRQLAKRTRCFQDDGFVEAL